jgi:ABC-2 type transport system permease protein
MVSKANPIVYMVNGFRYGILGVSDVGLVETYSMIALFIILLFGWALYLMNRGVGIRS